MLVPLLTTLLAVPALVAAAPTYVTDPSSSGFLIQPEGNENGCLTVAPGAGGVISNGNSVYLTQCATDFPSGVQGWEIARGADKIKLKNTNWCLDAGVNPSNGVRMKVWSCEQVPQQNWYYTDDNRIAITGGTVCLDNDAFNDKVQTWTCSSGNPNQAWTISGTPPPSSTPNFPPTPSPPPPGSEGSFSIHPNGNNGLCMTIVREGGDSFGFRIYNGDAVRLFQCIAGSPNQAWLLNRGNGKVCLRDAQSYCLDAGSSPANGIALKVWLDSPVPQQQWYYTDDDHIAITGGDQCVDLRDGNKSNGAVIQTWRCGSNVNQVWTRSASA